MIVGITGTNGAGKDLVAEQFVAAGFHRISLSDIIREELKVRRLPELRENTAMIGDELRKKDLGELSRRALARVSSSENAVIVSIRTPAEVAVFREHGNFYFIAVDAAPKLRYERTRDRGREGDQVSYEYFLEHDHKERSGQEAHEQQIDNLFVLADCVILNNGTKEEFLNQIKNLIQKMGSVK